MRKKAISIKKQLKDEKTNSLYLANRVSELNKRIDNDSKIVLQFVENILPFSYRDTPTITESMRKIGEHVEHLETSKSVLMELNHQLKDQIAWFRKLVERSMIGDQKDIISKTIDNWDDQAKRLI